MNALSPSSFAEHLANFYQDDSSSESGNKTGNVRKRLWSECFEEQQKSFKKIKLDSSRNSTEMMRFSEDEVIHINDVLKGTYHQHLLDKVQNIFENALKNGDFEELGDISELDDDEELKTPLEELHQGKLRSAIALGHEILTYCDEQKAKYNAFKKKIKLFVSDLLKKLPFHQSSFEPDPKYLEIAENFAKNHPERLPKRDIHSIAYRLQVANHLNSCDEITEAEKETVATLGHLLFLCQNSLEMAASAIQNNLEESVKTIHWRSSTILKEIFGQIKQDAEIFRKTFIQHHHEYILQKTSLEMARCLILPNGGINFGLVAPLQSLGFAKDVKDSVAANTMRHNLGHLNNPQILMLLEQVKLPSHPHSPSAQLIRITLGLKHDEKITQEHVLTVIISALIRDFRQAQAGTCFVTADLINKSANHPYLCLEDYMELIQESALNRFVLKELKSFPFQLTVTKENLNCQIAIDPTGKVLQAVPEDSSLSEKEEKKIEEEIFLWNIPSIKAILDAIGLYQTKQAVLKIIPEMGKTNFTIDEFIQESARFAYRKPELSLRTKEIASKDDLVNKARYAFSGQLLHPFHRAYEQVRASIVQYFGSQYIFAQLTFKAVKKTLSSPNNANRYYEKLLERLFMPMIARMKYRYNPHLHNDESILKDGSCAVERDYGYQLWDMGIPKDYQFDPKYYQKFYQSHFFIHQKPFEEYAPASEWKCLENAEDFRLFLIDVIELAAIEAKESHPEGPLKQLDRAAAAMIKKVKEAKFIEKLIFNFCEKDSYLISKYKKNEKVFSTTPWKLRWGGSPQIALYTNHNLMNLSIRPHEFSGTCKELLIYQINYLKKLLSENSLGPFNISMASPCHAFSLNPQEPSLEKAYLSEMDADKYIAENLINPCKGIGEYILPEDQRNSLVAYLGSQKWYRKVNEKHDYVRQEIGNKELFDQNFERLKKDLDPSPSYQEYSDWLCKVLIETRRKDPKIGKAHIYWENQLRSIFKKKLTHFFSDKDLGARIPKIHQEILKNYARNRKDTIALAEEEIAEIQNLAKQIPPNLSVKEFRNTLVDLAASVHEKHLGYMHKNWRVMIQSYLDNQIFNALPQNLQKRIKDSMIVAHDTNWVDGIHHLFFAYAVNPGSGELELCMYNKDTKELRFRSQKSWFPSGKEGRRWNFPGQYFFRKETSIFNFRKMELNEV